MVILLRAGGRSSSAVDCSGFSMAPPSAQPAALAATERLKLEGSRKAPGAKFCSYPPTPISGLIVHFSYDKLGRESVGSWGADGLTVMAAVGPNTQLRRAVLATRTRAQATSLWSRFSPGNPEQPNSSITIFVAASIPWHLSLASPGNPMTLGGVAQKPVAAGPGGTTQPERLSMNAVELQSRFAAGETAFFGADLHGADLAQADLHGIDLHGADLSDASLTDAVLVGANLDGAILTGADLHGARLQQAALGRANLADADLHGADLTDADLHRAELTDADLTEAVLHGADLHKANLHGALLAGADCRGADLHGAALIGTDLHGAVLHGADLHGADLHGADLHEADFTDADLHGAVLIADLDGANLTDAHLEGVVLPDGAAPA